MLESNLQSEAQFDEPPFLTAKNYHLYCVVANSIVTSKIENKGTGIWHLDSDQDQCL